MNFNFGEVLTRAWQIIWKHKVLWVFGILASCGQASSGGNSGGGGGDTGFQTQGPDLPPQVMQWLQTIEENMTMFIAGGIAVICILWILIIFLSTIGRIGLIHGTFQVEAGAEKLVFGQLFSESMPFFWRMFILSLILALPVLILVGAFFVGILVFALSLSGGNDASALGALAAVPLLIGCFCLLVPVTFVIGMIVRQSQNAIVLEDMQVIPALSRGWEVFRANLGPVIIMAIILAIIGFIVGLVVAIPILIVVVPAVITFALGDAQNTTPIIIAAVCLCLYIPVSILINGVSIAYTESAWTLTYMRLTKSEDNTPVVLEANE